jgi:hypothetical protein
MSRTENSGKAASRFSRRGFLAGKIIGQLYAREQTELTKFSLVNRTPPYLPPDPLRYLGINLYKRFF